MTKPVWMKLGQYIETAYDAGSRPDRRTVIGQIERGEIIGERRGGRRGHYWVLVDAETGLELKQHQIRATISGAGIVPVNAAAARVLQRAVG